MKHRGEKWTDEEIELLKKLYSAETKIDEIIPQVNHSNSAIMHKLKQLGLISRRGLWNEEEYKKLKELYESGLTYTEIAKVMGKTTRACQSKAIRLGLKKKECNVWIGKVRPDFWTEKDIEELKLLCQQELSRKEIAAKLNRSEKSINCKMNELRIFLKEKSQEKESEYRRVYTINDNYFENIDTQKKAYFLGWLVTDGYVVSTLHTQRGEVSSSKVGLKIQEQDLYVLEDFSKETESTFPIKNVKAAKPTILKSSGKDRIVQGGPQCAFEISSMKMVSDLSKYGIVQHKTYTIGFPELLKREFYPGFIAGVISGDGSVSLKKNHKKGILLRCDIAGNYGLLDPIKNILIKNIGFNKDKKITKYKGAKCLYNLELSQTETIKLYSWFKKNGISLMKRKNDIIEKYLEEKPELKNLL